MSTSNSNSDIGKDEVASETKNFLPMSSSDFNEGEDDASYYSDDSYEYDYSGDDGLDGRALQPAYQSLYNPDRISCPFCCEEQIDPGCGLILPKCLHSPCVKCFTKYVQTEVENGNADNIKCPFCNETVEMDVLKEVLDETSFQRLERLKDSAFVLKNPDYHHCPTPDCNGIVLCQVVVETETSANSSHSGDEVVHQLPSVPAVGQATEAKASPPPRICDCFKCGKTTCLSCGLSFHEGITCKEYELQQQMLQRQREELQELQRQRQAANIIRNAFLQYRRRTNRGNSDSDMDMEDYFRLPGEDETSFLRRAMQRWLRVRRRRRETQAQENNYEFELDVAQSSMLGISHTPVNEDDGVNRISADIIRRCQRCGNGIERISGCLHMQCRCGYRFCFKCGSNLDAGCDCVDTG